MTTITELQKRIVKALETGQDPAPIEKELAELRAKIAMEAEREQLQKVANERQQLRDNAAKVQEKVKLQSDSIDRFLELRDKLVIQLQPLLEPMKELAKMAAAGWEREPGACYSGFGDIPQFAAAVKGIPEGYLPADFGCPFLEMIGGQVDALNKASEAYSYFMSAHGILAGFTKGISDLPLRSAEGLMAIDNEPETEAGSCIVCSHAEVEAINNLLRQGKPLRDIESEFEVSRSSLSRHKNNCLNLGAVRVHD